jgi:hypothetical protein
VPPLREAEAVRVLLDALAVPRERIPAGLTEQTGSRVTGALAPETLGVSAWEDAG